MSTRTVSNTRILSRCCVGVVSLLVMSVPFGAALAATAVAPAIVSTRSGDPIAQAALVALASLEGLPQPAPVVTAVPNAPQQVPSTVAVAPTTVGIVDPQTGSVPPSTAAVAWTDSGQGWKSAVVDTDLVTQSLSPEQPSTTVAEPKAKGKKSKAIASTTTPPVVRILPASTVPSANGESAPVAAVADPSAVATPAVQLAPNEARRQLAELVVARGKLAPAMAATLDSAWASSDVRRQKAVFSALAQVGTPYRYSGNEPGGFDCSGLTSFAWAAAGVRLPRISTDQINAASPRAADALLPGDLVWRPGHIMMYVGIGQLVVDSPQTGKLAQVRDWGRVNRMGSPI